jgi:hypothetical protein
VSKLEQRRRANPSSILYWADLRDDPKLRRCSPAAKGLWAVHMLPAAAESPSYGVVMVDGVPALQKDLGEGFARELGETVEATQALIDELVAKGAASVDDQGRVYCRRMVREEKLRQQRSAAGKLGAAAKWQTDGEPHGEPYGERHDEKHGERDGKTPSEGHAENASQSALNGHGPANGRWQPDGEGSDEAMPSSLSSLSSHPSHPLSLERDSSPSGDQRPDDGIDGATVDAAFAAWDAAAKRYGWPPLRKIDADRKAKMRARLRENGGLDGLNEALEMAAASKFVREQMGFNLDWLQKPANWRKLIEGNYADDRRRNPGEGQGRVDAVREVAEAFRRRAGVQNEDPWKGVDV